MKKDIETTFEYAKEHLTLSESEKAFHRDHLTRFMRSTRARPVLSPLSPHLFAGMRYAFALLLFLGMGGTGIAFAAEKTLPGNPLYIVKVRVSEPVQVALTFDPKEKADLEVELVNRRLKEIAEASTYGNLDPEALTVASESLSENIDAAQQIIASLHENEDTDTAFETAAGLKSTLSVHSKVLKKVSAANPETASDIEAISDTVESESDETDILVESTTAAVSNSASDSLDESADSQQDDTLDSLEKVKSDIKDALATFDASDLSSIDSSLEAIHGIIERAHAKDDAGDIKGAYLLYSEADQKIIELKTTLEADHELGIDVIDSANTTP